MARRLRLSAYALSMKGQAEKPALSVKDRLSQMKEKEKRKQET